MPPTDTTLDQLFWLPAELRLMVYESALRNAGGKFPTWTQADGIAWLAHSRQLFEEAAPYIYSQPFGNDVEIGGDVNDFFFLDSPYYRDHHRREYGKDNAPYTSYLARRMLHEAKIKIFATFGPSLGCRVFRLPIQDFKRWYGRCLTGLWQVPQLKKFALVLYVNFFSSEYDPGLLLHNDRELTSFWKAIRLGKGRMFLETHPLWPEKFHYIADATRQALPDDCKLTVGRSDRQIHYDLSGENPDQREKVDSILMDILKERFTCLPPQKHSTRVIGEDFQQLQHHLY